MSASTSTITVDTSIKSDTKEAVDEITRACEEDLVVLLSYFDASRRRLLQVVEGGLMHSDNTRRLDRMLRGGITAAFIPPDTSKPLRGLPMMVVDVTSLDTYPGAIFQQPGKTPGEPLDGFAAVDPVTGAFLPIAAPAPGQGTAEIALPPSCRRLGVANSIGPTQGVDEEVTAPLMRSDDDPTSSSASRELGPICGSWERRTQKLCGFEARLWPVFHCSSQCAHSSG